MWEFGSKQVCHNALTGEHKVVFGDKAVFSDGPFARLRAHPDDPDVALLQGPGDPETCALHSMDECGALTPRRTMRRGFPDWELPAPDAPDGEEASVWVSDLQASFETLALELPGGRPLRLQFRRFEAPSDVGGKPVSLWVGFGRIADFVLRAGHGQDVRRYSDAAYWKRVRSMCTAGGLHEDNWREATRYRKKRAAPEAAPAAAAGAAVAGLGAEEQARADMDWEVSVRGLLWWLWRVVQRGQVTRTQNESLKRAQAERAEALLQRLLLWPVQGGEKPELLAVQCEDAGFLTVLAEGVVDKRELVESEATSGGACRDVRTARASSQSSDRFRRVCVCS